MLLCLFFFLSFMCTTVTTDVALFFLSLYIYAYLSLFFAFFKRDSIFFLIKKKRKQKIFELKFLKNLFLSSTLNFSLSHFTFNTFYLKLFNFVCFSFQIERERKKREFKRTRFFCCCCCFSSASSSSPLNHIYLFCFFFLIILFLSNHNNLIYYILEICFLPLFMHESIFFAMNLDARTNKRKSMRKKSKAQPPQKTWF